MPLWRILIESADGVFTPTGVVFEGDNESINIYLEVLKSETGKCHAAELVS
jgi:hypothetical protein